MAAMICGITCAAIHNINTTTAKDKVITATTIYRIIAIPTPEKVNL